jgi:hypothetical protein
MKDAIPPDRVRELVAAAIAAAELPPMLSEVRAALPGLDDSQVNRALGELADAGRIALVPCPRTCSRSHLTYHVLAFRSLLP